METTRSRRRSNAFARSARNPCGPFSASTDAYWEMEQGLEVVWLITLPISLIKASGPAA